MMDYSLLHRIYHFPGLNIPDTQDERACVELLDLFIEFSNEMVRFMIGNDVHIFDCNIE